MMPTATVGKTASPDAAGGSGVSPDAVGEEPASPEAFLAAGRFVDCASEAVRAFAARAAAGVRDPRERAVRLYYAVRDGIRYDPYACVMDPETFLAGNVAEMEGAFCVQKSVLYAACCRAEGIPARLGFADVRNHLASPRLLERMGTDLFVFHGYTEVWIDGAWRKATPVFNRELCERFGVKPLEFDGLEDSVFHEFDLSGRRHMEYIRSHGTFFDLPFDLMARAMREAYPNFGLGEASAGDDTAFAG